MDRDRLYDIIDGDYNIKAGIIYNYFMMAAILLSLLPLAFKEHHVAFFIIDKVTLVIFIADYLLRVITADKHLKKGKKSFFIYPFTPMAMIDLVSILPSLTLLAAGFRLFRVLRLMRTFRVLKAFKIFRYSRSVNVLLAVIRKQRNPLLAVAALAAGYILVSALVIFNVEPDTFNSFFDAVYWATISLVTVGYGDIYPITAAGKAVTILSSFMGVAIIALPSGVITAGYLEEIKTYQEEEDE